MLLGEITYALQHIPKNLDSQEIVVSDDAQKSTKSLTFELRRETGLKIMQDLGFEVEKQNLLRNSENNIIVNLKIDEIPVTFILDEQKQTASNIMIIDVGTIEEEIALEEILEVVRNFIVETKKEEELNLVASNLEKINLMFDLKKIQNLEFQKYQIKSLYDRKNKVLFDVVYDLEKEVFNEVNLHDL